MGIAIIVGTRPEIIKMSSIIRECERFGSDYFILHTGQHYSYNMDRVFFEQLELPDAKYNLDIGSGMPEEQTGKILVGISNRGRYGHAYMQCVDPEKPYSEGGAVIFKC